LNALFSQTLSEDEDLRVKAIAFIFEKVIHVILFGHYSFVVHKVVPMRDEINKTEDLQKSVAENIKKVVSCYLSFSPPRVVLLSDTDIGYATCGISKGISTFHRLAVQFEDLFQRTRRMRAFRSSCRYKCKLHCNMHPFHPLSNIYNICSPLKRH
jgi:hypothetical protein